MVQYKELQQQQAAAAKISKQQHTRKFGKIENIKPPKNDHVVQSPYCTVDVAVIVVYDSLRQQQ